MTERKDFVNKIDEQINKIYDEYRNLIKVIFESNPKINSFRIHWGYEDKYIFIKEINNVCIPASKGFHDCDIYRFSLGKSPKFQSWLVEENLTISELETILKVFSLIKNSPLLEKGANKKFKRRDFLT